MSNKLFLILSNFTRYLFSVITFFFDERHTEAVAQRCSVRKVFLEISQNSQENTSARVSFAITLQAEKETLAQAFSCDFCEISKNTFSFRAPLVAATEVYRLEAIGKTIL